MRSTTASRARTRTGRLLAVGAATAALAAGLTVTGATTASAAGDLCGRTQSVAVSGGRYVVQNNHWNDLSAAGQCTAPSDAGFTVTSSGGSVPTNGAPQSYPSIFAGCHYGTCSTGFPVVQAKDVGAAATSVSVDTAAGQAFDASYDIWFDRTPNPTGQNDGTEIMIWLDHRGDATGTPQPIGSRTGPATIGGVTYDVWQGTGHGDKDWNVISFVATTPQRSADIRIADFTNESIARGSTEPDWYLTSVQFGFEPWTGGAGLSASGFSYTP